MATVFPGTTIEASKLTRESSRTLFSGIFAAGGITLSQVSIMTGLEPYMIQNWVKRGFVSSPIKKVYSKEQFARIVIINMLRDTLHIEKICNLIKIIIGDPKDTSDDLIKDDELYHIYVDMISTSSININDEDSVINAAKSATRGFASNSPTAKKQLVGILRIMLYAHAAADLKKSADEILSSL